MSIVLASSLICARERVNVRLSRFGGIFLTIAVTSKEKTPGEDLRGPLVKHLFTGDRIRKASQDAKAYLAIYLSTLCVRGNRLPVSLPVALRRRRILILVVSGQGGTLAAEVERKPVFFR